MNSHTEFKKGDILVSLKDHTCVANKYSILKNIIVKAVNHFTDNTLGTENHPNCIHIRNFRQATQEEISLYNQGIRQLTEVINVYEIY